jgi:hypothetical protein
VFEKTELDLLCYSNEKKIQESRKKVKASKKKGKENLKKVNKS